MKAAGKETEIHTPYLVCNTYMEKRLKEVKEAVPDMKIVLNSVENETISLHPATICAEKKT